MPNEQKTLNDPIILGLQKAAVILHALAFKLEDQFARKETLALVKAVTIAAERLKRHAE